MNLASNEVKVDLEVQIMSKNNKYIMIGLLGFLSSLASIMYMALLVMGFIDPSTTFNYFMMLVSLISLSLLKFAILGFDINNKG